LQRYYDSMILGLIKEKNLILELTQENSIEFLVQCIYLYILTSNGPCSTISSLPQRPCISHEVNICYTCYMTLLFSNLLLCFLWLHDHVTITVTMTSDVTDMWQCDHDVTLTLTLDLRKRKRKRKLNKKAKV